MEPDGTTPFRASTHSTPTLMPCHASLIAFATSQSFFQPLIEIVRTNKDISQLSCENFANGSADAAVPLETSTRFSKLYIEVPRSETYGVRLRGASAWRMTTTKRHSGSNSIELSR